MNPVWAEEVTVAGGGAPDALNRIAQVRESYLAHLLYAAQTAQVFGLQERGVPSVSARAPPIVVMEAGYSLRGRAANRLGLSRCRTVGEDLTHPCAQATPF